MDLLPGELELAIVDAAQRLLDERCDLSAVRAAGDGGDGTIAELWVEAEQQGWFGLAVPEADGGTGLSIVEQVLLFEELGRHLAPGPFLVCAAAASALAGTDFGSRVIGGEPLALGIDNRGADVRADGDRLSGHLPRVHHAGAGRPMICDVDGALWWVENVTYDDVPCIDATMRLATVDLQDAPAISTGVPTSELSDTLDLLVAAMAVGVADGALRLALTYAKDREQFGKPIGSFQAVKHKLAESAVRTETARCLVAMAAVEQRDLGRPETIAEARYLAVEHAVENASVGILLHGAIGWTVECDAQLFLKRARYLQQYACGPDELVELIVARAASQS